MTWESVAPRRNTAVVWMHGDFEGGRSYTVEFGDATLQMRVEREDAEAGHVDKKSNTAGGAA